MLVLNSCSEYARDTKKNEAVDFKEAAVFIAVYVEVP